ncbi:MAG TPA: GPW/gp25 family protein [Arachnia sp.]|nr:GPW/gp25 family protein [Arachnia sp.]HMR12278.1 GPW/gp25 family protein [Arachnia sp.]
MDIDSPWRYDERGRTARTTFDEHVRDMVELVLFTDPGERVNRPDFGSGLRQLVFAPNSPELAAALEFTMQAALQRELGDVLSLEQLSVTSTDASIRVLVDYVVLRTGNPGTAELRIEVP